MKKIIQFSLKNKFAIWLLTIIITIAGLYSGMNMKLETIPNISTPLVTVMAIYPGATPEQVAVSVTEPIEKRVENLDGVSVVSSSSFQNASSIQIEYDFDKDMEKAQNEVKEALSNLELPDGVEEPKVSRMSFSSFPVMSLSITNSDQSLTELTKTAEEEIIPELEGVEGVSTVQISGQQVDEVQLKFDETKLKKYGLTEETIKNLIKATDVKFPLGLYTFKDTQKSVVINGNVTSIDDLKAIKIPVVPSTGASQQGMTGGQQSQVQQGMTSGQVSQGNQTAQVPASIPTVDLKDLATIEVVGKAESISRTNGEESIGVQITSAQDANTVDVVNAVKEKLSGFEAKIDGLKVTTIFDQGKPIEESVATMLNKAIFGAIFAMIIILLFLRNFRTTIISVISIPLSILIAILLLKQMDITLNMMTLGAMTVAIGRVIDDSIVVIENIFRRMSLKNETLSGKELIVAATREMFMPIFSSTIVTIAVFLPLGLVKGPVGEMFLPFALTIVFALMASLLVAITIVPMMAHSLFKKGISLKQVHVENKPGKLASNYKKVLNWSLNHKIITFGLAILLLVGSLFLVPVIGVSFLPSDEQKMVVATYKPAPGQTLDEVERIATEAEEFFEERTGVKTIQFSVGGENPMNPGQSNSAMFFVEYDKDTKNFSHETEKVINDLKKRKDKGEWASQDFSGMGSSNALTFNVYGDNMDEIEPVVNNISKIFKRNESLRNVKTSISDTYEEYTLVPNQEKLSQLGLTVAQVGMGLAGNGQRQVLTTIENNGKEMNVYLEVEKDEYEDINELTDKTLQSPMGMTVPIKDVVDVKVGNTSDTITRRDGRIYASVSAEITTKDVSKVSTAVQKKVDTLKMPSTVDISVGGVSEDIAESFTQLGLAMLAAIAIVYLVLVITFGGGLAPLAILFSLPFTIIGGLLGLLIAGETLSVSAMIGALMLIGIVVTNAIVLIDRVIHKENDGLSTREALLEAAGTRVRPILMTAIATIGALIPLAIGMEGSGLISKGLGVTVIGGLTSSTLLTLVIVPIVYETLMKMKRKEKKPVEKVL
ncbi:efflux RND transporter permease subunit [Bacillus sp. ISL-40]|uniref:efflux RND transporter permease subunit n=1 Tax=unclassified Bacillus (in: firmicutes) TaxID=185979 RepID=UPI001BE7F000|nr:MULTISPECIES: efflux RND transporter permease subunit [unclassified Bacillus (in: firmicutes)]MBT2696757.1 efflux RND transporter permease subunit [Bacillus sp. ISL-40]MBT2721241.1 efflux RND transporter permease subunit [Bacillus sp. ISL-46]MBT2740073.1 efflux RND transporter permease subunit [Bacillus sp. ISL-77]